MPVTLEDVARRAGVSKMTASRALRGTGRVNAGTRERVLEAARAIGYRPNPMVQTLMSNIRRQRKEVTANLAWVFSSAPGNEGVPPEHRKIFEGARERATEFGFGFEEVQADGPDITADGLKKILDARGVAGAVIAPLRRGGEVPPFPWHDFPMATIGRSIERPALHYCMAHHYHIMERALDELLRRGYGRIGFLNTRGMDARGDHGALMTFARADVPGVQFHSAFVDEWGEGDFRNWLREANPDAVVAAFPKNLDQLRAVGAPEDTGLLALSWRETHADYAGIRHAWNAIGAATVDMVVAQIHRNERGIPARPKAMLIEGDWIEGNTLRSPQTGS